MADIEKGIPIPVGRLVKKTDPLFEDFAKMEIGDSILYNIRENGRLVQSSASQYKTAHKKTWDYTTRTQPDGKIRIWRVAVKKPLKPTI